jgi:hypothetical protein
MIAHLKKALESEQLNDDMRETNESLLRRLIIETSILINKSKFMLEHVKRGAERMEEEMNRREEVNCRVNWMLDGRNSIDLVDSALMPAKREEMMLRLINEAKTEKEKRREIEEGEDKMKERKRRAIEIFTRGKKTEEKPVSDDDLTEEEFASPSKLGYSFRCRPGITDF